jgi:hypothetical protein
MQAKHCRGVLQEYDVRSVDSAYAQLHSYAEMDRSGKQCSGTRTISESCRWNRKEIRGWRPKSRWCTEAFGSLKTIVCLGWLRCYPASDGMIYLYENRNSTNRDRQSSSCRGRLRSTTHPILGTPTANDVAILRPM